MIYSQYNISDVHGTELVGTDFLRIDFKRDARRAIDALSDETLLATGILPDENILDSSYFRQQEKLEYIEEPFGHCMCRITQIGEFASYCT